MMENGEVPWGGMDRGKAYNS